MHGQQNIKKIVSRVLRYDFPENPSYPYQSYACPKPTAVIFQRVSIYTQCAVITTRTDKVFVIKLKKGRLLTV